MPKKKIPQSTISRLIIYLREITELDNVNVRTVSSAELGERTNLSDAQVRKDLGYFGQFGVSGSGYCVKELKKELERILGKDQVWNVALVGAGKLGSALLSYSGFRDHQVNIVVAFDTAASKIGKKVSGVEVRPLDELAEKVDQYNIAIGIITVPPENAQEVLDKMAGAGIEYILNFAPVSLNVPEKVKVKEVDLSRELETLSYLLVNKK